MVVGSFTSVSLNPPLVAFLPDHSSSTWARLRHASHFCVNILGAEQASVCSRFASKDPSLAKFDGHAQHRSPGGAPLIDAAVAWIDCERYQVYEAGDHDIVIGAVKHLDMSSNGQPLLFCQGGYGQFVPFSRP
jgi:flavin reductase (DIM6/NTAB) family NADH-FMN oxidoreductase RutF